MSAQDSAIGSTGNGHYGPIATLKEKIKKQKNIHRLLETDLQHPRLLDEQIATQTEILKHLPQRLDDEIKLAEAHLLALKSARDSKIRAKAISLSELSYRREHLQELYTQAWDDLQAMNQQLKQLEHGDTLAKLREIERQYKALQAELPEHLRKVTKEQLQGAEE